MLYYKSPGDKNVFFDSLDLMNLPNPITKDPSTQIKDDFNVNKLMMAEEVGSAALGFNYYKYKGSLTSPPCSQDVTWYIVHPAFPLGNTNINLIRDSLNIPSFLSRNKDFVQNNFDGNNREIQSFQDREIFFFDMSNSCQSDLFDKLGG
jgi:carbonic anhydrase